MKETCNFRKYPYSPNRRDWSCRGLGGEGGFCKAKTIKESISKVKLLFQRGWVLEKIPSVGEVWIFSGIAPC